MCCFRGGAAACWALSTRLSSWRIRGAASWDHTSSTYSRCRCRTPSSECHSRYYATTDDHNRQQCCHDSSDSSSSATDDVTPRFGNDTQVTTACKPCEWAHVALPETASLQLQVVLQWQAETSLLTHAVITLHLLVIGQLEFHPISVAVLYIANLAYGVKWQIPSIEI